MATRKSTRITTKADPLTQKERTGDTVKRTKNAQGSRHLKKRKISDAKDTSNDLIADKSTHRTKGKNGNLKFAYDIPFDVLLEIFQLLEPIDLLHLSRVSKSLHDSLTSNDMISLWKSAYKNVPEHQQPPFCPENTNIVFYTNFLYGRHCQVCSSIYGRIHHESAFIRLCSKCANDSFLSSTHDLKRSASRLCSWWSIPTPNRRGGVEAILKEEYSLRLRELKQAQQVKQVQRYAKVRETAIRERASVAFALSRWRRRMQESRMQKMNRIRARREADMKKKLEEEGRKADSDNIRYNWAKRVPHARKPRALTDSEWSFIRADILDFFLDIREEEALANMKNKLRCRIANLGRFISQWRIRPTVWWITSSEPIASFMKSQLPENTYEEDFKKVEAELHNVITSWQEETDRYLANLIPRPAVKGKKKTSRDGDTNALELATTFFKCHWCTEPISYPRILMHSCFLRTDDKEEAGNEDDREEDDMEDFEEDVVVDAPTRARGPRQPRPPMEITPSTVLPMLSDYYSLGMCAGKVGVTFDEEASNAARDIITVCGEDPNTVSHVKMGGMLERLECLRCSRAMQEKPRAKSARLVMKWNMAIVHELEEHYGEPPSSEPAWRRIDSEEDLDKVKRAENHMKTLKKYESPVSCNHCSWQTFSLQQQLHHIDDLHKILKVDEATVLQHFSSPVDASIKILHPASKI